MTTQPVYASASLYVGDLVPEVTEAILYEVFKQVGPVATIKVCRDAVTRRSLGYAYVNYHNVVDAERAIDFINYKEIKGVPCRIMWSQRDPAMRKSNVGNIFIKNLDKNIDNKALYDTFATFGNILSCKVATDDHGNSKGFGFVHYDTQEAADLAIVKVNGKLLNGKKCFVGSFQAKKERFAEQSENEPKWTNIYVKHLDKSVDDDKLKEMFTPFGTVTSAVIMRDENGESKGFGFINFETNEAAKKAVEEMNDKELDGKQIYVGRAQKKSERERELKDMFQKIQKERQSKYQGVNLYVKNLDESITDEQLRQEFSHIGTITSAKVMSDDKGASKGFGFVCFSTPEEATKAVTEMNGKLIANKPAYVALAQRKEQRRMQLEAMHVQRQGGPVRMPGPGMVAPMYPVFYPPPGRGGFVAPVYPQGAPVAARGGRYPPRGGYGTPGGYAAPRGGRGGRGTRGGARGGAQQPGGAPGQYPMKYQINPNVRNQQVPVVPTVPATEPTALTPEDRKMMLGETLYPQIEASLKTQQKESLAGKITGMLLESLDQVELMQLLESTDALNKKIDEALDVLDAHTKTE
jgi:polyadenylate-binding protein